MNKTLIVLLVLGLHLPLSRAWAAIADPDALVYGQVLFEGQPVTDNFRVIARVNDVPEPVGIYEYGTCVALPSGAVCPPADQFYLKIRVESLVDNTNQIPSVDAAKPGDTVKLFVQEGDGEEVLAGTLNLDDRGIVRQLDLVPGAVDSNPLFEGALNWYDTLLPAELLNLIGDLEQNP